MNMKISMGGSMKKVNHRPPDEAAEQSLFTHAPYPVCLVSSRGHIAWGNPAFWQLAHLNHLETLAEFDTLTGGTLAKEAKRQGAFLTSLRPASEKEHGERQIYSGVSWRTAHATTLIVLFEQTGSHQRKNQRHHFEGELIHYLAEVAERLAANTAHNKHALPPDLLELTEELADLSQYLGGIYGLIHTTKGSTTVNIGEICERLLDELRRTNSEKRLHVVTTFPHQLTVQGERTDIAVATRALLEAVFFQAHPQATIRIHARRDAHKVTLIVTIEDQVLSAPTIAEVFQFSTNQGHPSLEERFWHVQLAAAQQLFLKHRGWIHVHSEADLGTVYEVTLGAAAE